MKTPPKFLLTFVAFASSIIATAAFAEPIEFKEISLLVRARESEASILQEVHDRKLVRALTPQQEATLKTQGAADSLIRALKAPAVVLPAAEASAFEARREQSRKQTSASAQATKTSTTTAGAAQEAEEALHVFEVSVGHPVNLSHWGGPHYEFAFRGRARLDDGQEDAILTDTFRSFTHVGTYLGAGRPDDSTTIFDRRNYISVADHSFTRGLRIDRRNPVWKKGVPYTLYPVYAAGGVSLYFIGNTSDTVKLAVSTNGR
ncbi:MAG: hypothetical protein ABR589_09870 [Chthoniobacterales bacterium]